MRVILIAAMTPSGVIGRTSKPCGGIAHTPSADIYGGGATACLLCGGEGDSRAGVPPGRIPCNDLPWGRAYPEHEARVEALTMGHAVIAGRLTAEGMGKAWPLGGRTSCVVSRSMYLKCLKDAVDTRAEWRTKGHFPGVAGGAHVILRPTLGDALQRFSWPKPNRQYERVYIIGGARLFAEALPLATHLDLTLIGREWPGDVKFPEWESFVDDPRSLGHGPVIARTSSGLDFECVSREPCPTNTDLTWTKWVRHEEQKGGG